MLNTIVRGCLFSACFVVFCSSSVCAQVAASGDRFDGGRGFGVGDVFSSRGYSEKGRSPLEMRRIRTKASRPESSPDATIVTGWQSDVGDVFSGYGRNVWEDVDRSNFVKDAPSTPGSRTSRTGIFQDGDVFAFHPTVIQRYYPASKPVYGVFFSSSGVHHQTGTQGPYDDVFSSSGVQGNAPLILQGATNGTIRNGKGSRRLAYRSSGWGPPSLEGATNGTIRPPRWKSAARPSTPRWDTARLPLKVYISGTVDYARGGLFRSEIKSALRQWASASGGAIKYTITPRFTESDIYFVCQQTENGQWAENSTQLHNHMYDRVKVCFLLETLEKLERSRVRALCLHEIGHALGIRNHSNDSKDAMSLAATEDFHPVVTLTNGDKKLISALYQ